MTVCRRCHSSMYLEYHDAAGRERVWRCFGCGREVLEDRARQVEDDRCLERINEAVQPKPRDSAALRGRREHRARR